MNEIFDTRMRVPASVIDAPTRVVTRPEDFRDAEIFRRSDDVDELYGRTMAEAVGDKLFYGAVGATVLTLAAGVVAAKKITAKR